MKVDDKPKKEVKRGASFTVNQDETIEAFLARAMQGKSRTSIKQLLQKGAITVGRRTLHRLDDMVHAGETVFVGKRPEPKFPMPDGLRILWEDRWLIVVKKDTGLLTVGNDSEQLLTAQVYLDAYMQFKKEPSGRVYIVHRIDRDTSGVLLFAKDENTQQILRSNWNEIVHSRRYIAVVEGVMQRQEGTIDTWIEENPKTMTMYISRQGVGKRAITHYSVMDEASGYSLLALELETGRKNQIRVHMKHIGHPVAGDGKYGAQTDPCGRLCLHAQQIEFEHPVTGEMMEFTSEIPREFLKIFKPKRIN
ncbi:MAG: RluA family pseudouridine synthase [Bacteroidales bacterium]|nr:RluA family pseudouridine synthase [Bacteroidales bacterium]